MKSNRSVGRIRFDDARHQISHRNGFKAALAKVEPHVAGGKLKSNNLVAPKRVSRCRLC